MGLPEPPDVGASALPPGTFDGAVVAVTGGGTGLGKAIAVEFARLGASVAILSRNPAHHQAGIAAIGEVGARATAVACDVRDPDQVGAAFNAVVARLGLPDVLVNNAAGNFPVAAEELSPNGWRAVTQIVADGTFFCSREFARRHLDAGTPGSIVNIGASYAWTGGPGFVHSAAAKAAVKNLTETLAVEWAPYGIRVNCLVPGLFPHEDEADHIRGVPERGDREDERSPAGRVGRPRELGWAATFLASPYGTYISGATLTVDGANWQRRSLLQPPFTPIRDQLS
ncbi:MAG: SDR family oxidoreductase [Actinobacteria bacterium]|nr:SDR family oxidoreductase [Actinomycetota bacterium]